MKKFLFTIITLLLVGLNTYANKYLIQLNPEWLNQEDIDVREIEFTPNNATELIQKHLLLVENTLRNRSTENLSASQKANREHCLDILHEYAIAGVFPQNENYLYQTPIFVDAHQTYCAVGHIMKETGHKELADLIDRKNEIVYVKDIKEQAAMDWMNEQGLSLEECAWIQPGYSSVLYIFEENFLDLSGLTPTNPIVNRSLGCSNGKTFSASLTATGNPRSFSSDTAGNAWFFYDSTGAYYTLNIEFSSPNSKLVAYEIDNVFINYSSYSRPLPVLNEIQFINTESVAQGGVYTECRSKYTRVPGSPIPYYTENPSIDTIGSGYDNSYFNDSTSTADTFKVGEFQIFKPRNISGTTASYQINCFSSSYSSSTFGPVKDGATHMQFSTVCDDNASLTSVLRNEYNLTLQKAQDEVKIEWQVPNHNSDTTYKLERSADATTWSTLATLDSPFAFGSLTFMYTDDMPLNGMNYYRIQVIYNNQAQSYSQNSCIYVLDSPTSIKDIQPQSASLEIIGGNIVKDRVEILFDKSIADKTPIVYDINGRVMGAEVNKQSNTAIINISSLVPGQYLVSMGGRFVRFYKE